jgi:hypothetical protein
MASNDTNEGKETRPNGSCGMLSVETENPRKRRASKSPAPEETRTGTDPAQTRNPNPFEFFVGYDSE